MARWLAIGTLVERTTRFAMLLHPANGRWTMAKRQERAGRRPAGGPKRSVTLSPRSPASAGEERKAVEFV